MSIAYVNFARRPRPTVNINIGSPAGAYASSSTPFFWYVVRLGESDLSLTEIERDALDVLSSIPHAYFDEDAASGLGWRIVPPSSHSDWPVMEVHPDRLRRALQVADKVLWDHAMNLGITAGDIELVDQEIERIMGVVDRAEAAGYRVNLSYVS